MHANVKEFTEIRNGQQVAERWIGMAIKKGRIISDISKRVLIVEGQDELNRIMHIYTRYTEGIVRHKKLAPEIYEIEIIQRVGSFYGR